MSLERKRGGYFKIKRSINQVNIKNYNHIWIHETQADRKMWRKKLIIQQQIWRLKYPTMNNGCNNWTENRKWSIIFEQKYKTTRPNTIPTELSPQNSRMHILLKLAWDIF